MSLRTVINGKVCVECYNLNDIVPCYLQTVWKNDFSSLSYLHIPKEESDNIMDMKNRRKGIGFRWLVLIETSGCTYEYIYELWVSK